MTDRPLTKEEKQQRAIANYEKLKKIPQHELPIGTKVFWQDNNKGMPLFCWGEIKTYARVTSVKQRQYRIKVSRRIAQLRDGWQMQLPTASMYAIVSVSRIHDSSKLDPATEIEKASGIPLQTFLDNPAGTYHGQPYGLTINHGGVSDKYALPERRETNLKSQWLDLRGGAKQKLLQMAKSHNTDPYELSIKLRQQGVTIPQALIDRLV